MEKKRAKEIKTEKDIETQKEKEKDRHTERDRRGPFRNRNRKETQTTHTARQEDRRYTEVAWSIMEWGRWQGDGT